MVKVVLLALPTLCDIAPDPIKEITRNGSLGWIIAAVAAVVAGSVIFLKKKKK